MRRAVDRLKKDNKKATFVLQLTAMVDMFTILIVFLLKSFSTSAVHITPHKGLNLPYSTTITQPSEAIRLVVANDGIYVEDQKVVTISEGKFASEDLEDQDQDFIRPLFEVLDKEANKSKDISKLNEDHVFEGKVVMQADGRLPYSLLKKVMYTSSLAGYADLKLATISVN
ncbi:MAG: biopolymer transporter ExbD [Bdellovibrionales bacterium]|nr:biopolymer transporter ExbD [Bdellovibrionales bacterium]